MKMSEKIDQLAAALAKAQAVIRNAVPNAVNPYYSSEYANLAEVWACVREAIKGTGLAITQTTAVTGDMTVLVTTLMHESGQWLQGEYPIAPCRQQKDRGWVDSHDPQAYGMAISYARRYALAAIIGIATEDDDAESATHPPVKRAETEAPARPAPAPVRAKANDANDETDEGLAEKLEAELKKISAITGRSASQILEEASSFTGKDGKMYHGKKAIADFRRKNGDWQVAWMRATLGRLRQIAEEVGADSLENDPDVPEFVKHPPASDEIEKLLDEIWSLAESLTSATGNNCVDAVLIDAGLSKFDVLKKRSREQLREALAALKAYKESNQ